MEMGPLTHPYPMGLFLYRFQLHTQSHAGEESLRSEKENTIIADKVVKYLLLGQRRAE